MKSFLLLLLVLGWVVEMNAQNLVPNPSFELYTSCPNDVGLIDFAVDWTAYGNGQWAGPGTPDYFNTCANATQFPDSLAGVPHNLGGYQQPATANAYAGIICYASTVANSREIIGCHLISPLQIGQTYLVSFKANCSFGGYAGNYLATNGLGVKFSSIPYSNSNPIPIDNAPMLYSTNVITDTLNWTIIESNFIADSAYQYFALGNFMQDASIDTIHLGSFIFRSYYYIDDVSVTKLITEGIEQPNPTTFTLSPNPITSLLTITNPSGIKHLTLTNSIGQIVFEESDFAEATSDKVSVDVSSFPAGVYFVQLKDEKEVWVKEVVIQH